MCDRLCGAQLKDMKATLVRSQAKVNVHDQLRGAQPNDMKTTQVGSQAKANAVMRPQQGPRQCRPRLRCFLWVADEATSCSMRLRRR
ncbi:hypothetical protein NDU88_006414 [Pleurodeles waltl]|uniref:Uncharacterized protein n=1 Tax=Pleurodeles waltl TaxID=8319 RepID=A0AAV7WXI5_PLEWA|nr:hypothetical protein NDU88_006414 [Pleurodeles waltl]